jgi:hypothetical protein
VAAVWFFGFRGPDVPAQLYLSELFRAHGWVLWDNGWYGGHYLASYSVLFAPLAGSIGLYGAALVCAAVAAWAFEHLVVTASGQRNNVAVLLFAASTIVAVAIGQLPFLAGEAAGLLALVAARGDRRAIALLLGASCALFSEVAGVFLVLAITAWALTSPRWRRGTLLVLGAGAALPIVVLSIALPRLGPFPFSALNLALVMSVCIVGAVGLPKHHRTLRVGLALYAVAAVVIFVVPNPLGGNIGRLTAYFAPPLVAYLATLPGRRVFAVFIVPLLAWQYLPVLGALRTDASASASYSAPVVQYLTGQPSIGRLEIPFTRGHWEAAYVAPHVSLARGWLRQLDTLDNPIFYSTHPLDAATYHRWLIENGIAWVALPDVALDYSAVREARLLTQGLPYLHLAWHNTHWRVWAVVDSPGLVSGPARVTRLEPNRVTLAATATGPVLVRVHYTPMWNVASGPACILEQNGKWTRLKIQDRGKVELTTSLLPNRRDCDMEAASKSRSRRSINLRVHEPWSSWHDRKSAGTSS